MEKEFDGTPLTAEDASHKIKDNVRLYGKDQLIVVYGGEVTMPGETVGYIVSCRAEDENGNDVSYRYEFDISATSVLKVTKRELKVYSEDSVKIHDGEPLTCPYLEEGYERKLLPGHFLSVEFSGNQTDIGMGENIFTAKVVDELGNEIPEWQEMYKLEKVYGCLKVVYSFLIFETNSISKEYDGSPLRADGECRYVGGERLEGHCIESAGTNQSRTEPGTTLNRPTVVIRDQDGNDVSYMYDLAEEKMGVIRVNRIKLKITSGSVEIRFDPSNPHAMLKCEEYTCEGAVLSDHRVNVMISVYLDSVGECDNQIDFVTVTDSRGRDVSGYYDIETENGTLKILPPVS